MNRRVPLATVAGLAFFVAYVAVAVVLADRVLPAPWPVQALYFLVVGSLWVLPIRWLMYWGAGRR